jgi:hypothetical protein
MLYQLLGNIQGFVDYHRLYNLFTIRAGKRVNRDDKPTLCIIIDFNSDKFANIRHGGSALVTDAVVPIELY